MILFTLMVDSITSGVQVASLSHSVGSVWVSHLDEMANMVILLVFNCSTTCWSHLHRLAWLLIDTSVAILFELIAEVQHWPASNRVDRLSDWLGELNRTQGHPIGADGRCLVLLLYQGKVVQSRSVVGLRLTVLINFIVGAHLFHHIRAIDAIKLYGVFAGACVEHFLGKLLDVFYLWLRHLA